MGTINDNNLSFADYVFQQVCPDNKFLEEMNEIIPWGELHSHFSPTQQARTTCLSDYAQIQNSSASTMVRFIRLSSRISN